MILSVDINEKSFGNNVLYKDMHFDVQDNEKVALVGRNGTGKTTLLHIITGQDKDYDGEVRLQKGITLIGSRQEHHAHDDKTVMDYILGDLPEYSKLHYIISNYPTTMGDDNNKIQQYTDALERFGQLGYFEVESDIVQALESYQISEAIAQKTLKQLSGGQKRLVELVKVQRARAHIALIDEPTNHMDYVAKKSFIKWFVSAREAVVVITHDRDLLHEVDRVIEIKDSHAVSYKGNYDDYLRTNASKTVSAVHEFNVVQRRIANLTENVVRFRRLKEKSRDPGTIARFKSLENKAKKELETLQKKEKPSFWIDRESAQDLNDRVGASYQEHKTRNIKVRTKNNQSAERLLVDVSGLSLGYNDSPLFSDVSFQLREGERLRIHGRNGAGKSTLVSAIIAKSQDQQIKSQKFKGVISVERELKIGVYEQEISASYLGMTLGDAIEQAYMQKNVIINDTKIKQLLSDYLFNPATDSETPISRLSGGQKARFQLINMLIGDPQILVLDEPTNHLDLPSIEELEDALASYSGAILFISHDSYFAKTIAGSKELLIA